MADIFELFNKISSSKPTLSGSITHIVVGLGNVGNEYEKTRHNAGFIALDEIARRHSVNVNMLKFHAMVGEGAIGGHRVLLMKPTTFMNNSGTAVAEAASFYKIAVENIIVLHDEISFDVGNMRIRRRGSAGGHNGLKSIIAHIGSEDFPRIKIGVGKKPSPEYDLAAHVLGRFPESDLTRLSALLPDIEAAVCLMLDGKIDDAMTRFSH